MEHKKLLPEGYLNTNIVILQQPFMVTELTLSNQWNDNIYSVDTGKENGFVIWARQKDKARYQLPYDSEWQMT